MDFGFNLEQKSLSESVSRLLDSFSIMPSPDYDAGADAAIWNGLAEIGLFALLAPEAYGGVGLALVDLALAVERLGSALVSPLVAHTLIATDLITRFGTPAQKDALLPAICAGALRVALATAEAGYGFGRGEVAPARANILLNGSKIMVPGADRADMFLVLRNVAEEPSLVFAARSERGVSVQPYDSLDSSMGFSEVCFRDVACDPLGESKAAVARLLDVAPTVYAGLQTGIAAHMLECSVEYARTRVQFGQLIGAFQAIKHRCADMAVALDVARSAAYYAFWAVSEDPPDRSRASSMAKAYCGEVASNACNDAIQIHGGMGFTWELGLHRFLRRAKMLEQSFGDRTWHYERVLTETLSAQAAADYA